MAITITKSCKTKNKTKNIVLLFGF
jgi:hypothetical protein